MSYSKPTDEGIDNCDDDYDESDIVDDVSISLVILLVYVKAAEDKEENSNNYLKSSYIRRGKTTNKNQKVIV